MTEDQIQRLAAAIRAERARRGLSQRQYAAEIGVSGPAVAQWERCVAVPSVARRVELVKRYRLPIRDWLPELDGLPVG